MRLFVRDAASLAIVGEAIGAAPLFADAIADGRAVVIPNGVDVDRARRMAAAPSPHRWLDGGPPVVLGIGRLHPQKNFDLLIEACALLRTTTPLRLVILGAGAADEKSRLQALADARGLGPDFLLAGETDNVFAWLSRAAVFALPSRWEGSSMALLEALAVDVPVVVSRAAGDAEQVLDRGRYGRLVDGDDPPAVAAAIADQLSPARILPGDRATAYSLGATLDRYAALVDRVAALA